eukprot:gnl/Trimastix_PCT/3450.p1 GENE.gnl/Trimastix_PCT/3450~~gnl/Trimastix_PCT/3450.p1  ORF type:complete len:483 (+),score=97.56 gnl/Trimastix_PCT/3450:121-1569(+)
MESPSDSHNSSPSPFTPQTEVKEELPRIWVDCYQRRSTKPLWVLRMALYSIILLPLRIILLILLLLPCFIALIFFSLKLPPPNQPLGRVRRFFDFYLGRPLGRALLFLFGFYWVQTHGKPQRDCRLVVANHAGVPEVMWMLATYSPSFVIADFLGRIPILGRFARFQRCVIVDRRAGGNLAQINERFASNLPWPPLCMFPEGQTSNGTHICRFRTGAFVPGEPCQPVVFRYKSKSWDPTWSCSSGVLHVLGLLTQLFSRLEVTYLPVYVPSQAETRDPALYARNVRDVMSGVYLQPTSETSRREKAEYRQVRHELQRAKKTIPQPHQPILSPHMLQTLPLLALDTSKARYVSQATTFYKTQPLTRPGKAPPPLPPVPRAHDPTQRYLPSTRLPGAIPHPREDPTLEATAAPCPEPEAPSLETENDREVDAGTSEPRAAPRRSTDSQRSSLSAEAPAACAAVRLDQVELEGLSANEAPDTPEE